MLSICLLAHNSPALTRQCLHSLMRTFGAPHFQGHALEFVLVDDFSDPRNDVVGLFKQFKSTIAAPVTIIRLRSHQHYTHALSYGLSACHGDMILFVSHDMIVPPACVENLIETMSSL